MERCLIVGSVKTDAFTEKEKAPNTLYIAADGGYGQMKAKAITPDLLIGDFDSISETFSYDLVSCAELSCTEIIKLPVEKDDTDTLVAIKEAIKRGCAEIILYGCLGGERFDHSIATLQTLTYAAQHGVKITAVGDTNGKPYYVTAIHCSEITFSSEREGIFSVICAGAECTGVTVENAKYCIENAALSHDFPLGVSNAFIKGKSTRVSVNDGTLWVFYE